MDATLTLADVQALGSHNSYHLQPDALFEASQAYSHPPLDEQADLGVRDFELDVHRAEDGSFHVFHLPGVDPDSTCATLTTCLEVLRLWSDAHPCHSPLTLWIEPKDDVDEYAEGYTPLAGHVAELDGPIRAVWSHRLFTPDDLRQAQVDLPAAVARGWPLLAELRGMLLVALLDSDAHRDEYLQGAPLLEERAMFARADSAADPFAAIFKINDATSAPETVAELVGEGFLVTSTVDEVGEDDSANAARLAATLDAGPHHLATDFVVVQEGLDYMATLDGGSPRCHPQRVPQGCRLEDIEP